jgi:hypothetical protein
MFHTIILLTTTRPLSNETQCRGNKNNLIVGKSTSEKGKHTGVEEEAMEKKESGERGKGETMTHERGSERRSRRVWKGTRGRGRKRGLKKRAGERNRGKEGEFHFQGSASTHPLTPSLTANPSPPRSLSLKAHRSHTPLSSVSGVGQRDKF